MAIKLTQEEMELVKAGKLNPNDIEEHRKKHPVKEPDTKGLEKIKQEIRETNLLYKESIQKNKDLYQELAENRKRKEEFRNKLADLRKKKKELLGKE